MKRRDFIKIGTGILAGIALSSRIPGVLTSEAEAATIRDIRVTITDAIKEMATYNGRNNGLIGDQPGDLLLPHAIGKGNATCYFWVYQMTEKFTNAPDHVIPPDTPGPTIFCRTGDTIKLTVTNELDEPHAFHIPGIAGASTGSIPPIQDAPLNVASITFNPPSGAYLYSDNLNAPVNRVMGLHGPLIVVPRSPKLGQKLTPYSNPTPEVQRLFNDLGDSNLTGSTHWPGLAWDEGDPTTETAPMRQYVWICNQSSPKLFRTVGSLPAGQIFNAAEFTRLFTRDIFSRNSFDINLSSNIPTFFTIGGSSGHFCHNSPVVTPMARVGEPFVIHVFNAGLMAHSMHLHANHYFILSVDGVVQGTPVGTGTDNASLRRPGVIWVDTFTLNPSTSPASRYDLLVPMMRPPDIPNVKGIGRAGSGDAAYATAAGGLTYPPVEEFDRFQQKVDTVLAQRNPANPDELTSVNAMQRQSPLCFPMHDHSEPSQTSQGGNYNTALISGVYFIGDRNITLPRFRVNETLNPPVVDPAMPLLPPQTFPMDEDFAMMIFEPNPAAPNATICYGISEAVSTGLQRTARDSALESQADRPRFPAPFVDPDPPA